MVSGIVLSFGSSKLPRAAQSGSPIAHLGYRLLPFLKIPTGSHRLSGPDQLARNPAPLSALLERPPATLPLWLHEPVEKDRFLAL